MNLPGFSKRSLFIAAAAVLFVATGRASSAAPVGPIPQFGDQNLFRGEGREAAKKEVARLKKIQHRYANLIRSRPGVLGMGITANRQTAQLTFAIIVDPEASEPALPRTLEGVPVQVLRLPTPEPTHGGPGCQPCHTNSLPLPVEMGNSGRTGPVAVAGGCLSGRGSLGFKACDFMTDQIVYVTAAHLSTGTNQDCAGTAGLGAPTQHPAPFDTLNQCDPYTLIGTIAKERPPICGTTNWIDAASVNSADSFTQFSIRDIGLPSPYPREVFPGDLVQKSGRTTGHTQGEVLCVAVDIAVPGNAYCPCGLAEMVDQIMIVPTAPGVDWVVSGDSGSAVLDYTEGAPAIVGLNFAGAKDNNGVWIYGLANPIFDVVMQLDLSLNVLDCTLPCVAALTAQETPAPRRWIRSALDLRDYILTKSERGMRYIDTYYKITGELSRLVLSYPALFFRTASLFERALPAVDSMNAGNETVVSAELVRDVDALLARFAELSNDPQVDAAMAEYRRDLNDPEVLRSFGVTVVN
ncbi:MAG: hypothetical protein IAF94_01685 [Pirellulaceae bacterium]|nr:hypothetical protein [Pirellulaceae bacterium]